MNDFTKEELQKLFKFMVLCSNWNCKINEEDSSLMVKLESMIASYCEHKWRCWDDVHNTRECLKCGGERKGEFA